MATIDPNTAKLIAKALGGAMSALVATLGIRASDEVWDAVRRKMVEEGRGPTEAELDALYDTIQARSEQIQNS